MRRSLSVLLATVAGLALLAGFHTSPTQTAQATPVERRPTTPTPAPSPPAGDSPAGRQPVTSSPSSVPTSVPGTSVPTSVLTTTAPAPADATRVIDGPVEANRYGPVQVRVTLSGDRIVDVQALQLPGDRGRSVQINDYAGPALRQEVLQAQSAQIHTISGATYTSVGYRQSLQAALDRAGRP
jgi:uncharacterized protein with FMN-binding domain